MGNPIFAIRMNYKENKVFSYRHFYPRYEHKNQDQTSVRLGQLANKNEIIKNCRVSKGFRLIFRSQKRSGSRYPGKEPSDLDILIFHRHRKFWGKICNQIMNSIIQSHKFHTSTALLMKRKFE